MNKRMKASEVRCESFLDRIYRIKKEQENEENTICRDCSCDGVRLRE